MDIRSWIAFLVSGTMGVAAPSALAQATGGTSSATPGLVASLVPEFVTLEQKFAASDQVFVGIGRRIYWVDRTGREFPFDAAHLDAAGSEGRQAILEVGIEQELHASSPHRASGVARFVLATPLGTGIRPVSHEALAGRTIGKKAIYFATRRVVPDSQAGGTAGQRMAAPMQFSLVSTPARQGPVDNPLPIAELQSVMNAALIKGHDTEDPNCF